MENNIDPLDLIEIGIIISKLDKPRLDIISIWIRTFNIFPCEKVIFSLFCAYNQWRPVIIIMKKFFWKKIENWLFPATVRPTGITLYIFISFNLIF